MSNGTLGGREYVLSGPSQIEPDQGSGISWSKFVMPISADPSEPAFAGSTDKSMVSSSARSHSHIPKKRGGGDEMSFLVSGKSLSMWIQRVTTHGLTISLTSSSHQSR